MEQSEKAGVVSGGGMRRRRRGRVHTAEETEAILRMAWYRLRLSVRDPCRVGTWDAIVLTAASPEQAALYEWQLRRARRMGRIAECTVALAVPDPDGARIGSGAATLNAIAAIARHFDFQVPENKLTEPSYFVNNCSTPDNSVLSAINFMSKKHILLIHAGGDSKRVPWANPMGKVFLPLPYLAGDNLDGPVPLLFDHILAISSCARQAFKDKGGLFIMTGDVLPCFDASKMILPDDASCIITVPTTVDIASNHGVVVASNDGLIEENYIVSLVDNLLQKPTMNQLLQSRAILEDGRALLDTGIIAARGKAWEELLKLAYSSGQNMIDELMTSGKEMSLYEDLVAAWVPAKHEWLKLRPFGEELTEALGGQRMFSFCSYDFSFLHFGTSTEVLDHMAGSNYGLVCRRHLSAVPESTACDIAASAIILSSKISCGVAIGEDSLVYDSKLSGTIQIGAQTIVVGVNLLASTEDSGQWTENLVQFILPDRHCLWEVPLKNFTGRILVYCGLLDNPKISLEADGTFLGKPWRKILCDLKIQEAYLWNSSDNEKCLWNATLFPVLPSSEMLKVAMWLMGLLCDNSENIISMWRNAHRVSLEELHHSIDYPQLCKDSSCRQADLAAGIAKACLTYGLLGRDLSQLCAEILQNESCGLKICKELLALSPDPAVLNHGFLPNSRGYQVQMDILRACGDVTSSCLMEQRVWAAVATETALAVNYGFKDKPSLSSDCSAPLSKWISDSKEGNFHPKMVKIQLPVRIDFVGGWSDTPPWSLERPGCVLNTAICLEGSLPVGVVVETTEKTGMLIQDDAGNQLFIDDLKLISTPFERDDQFRLVKAALVVTGIIHHKILTKSGLQITTWANVPRGSGLGTSSILAAAVVKGLLQIMDEDSSNETVTRTVLVVEQIMGTGGGWQDQIGGLYPGIKCSYSFPGQPLRLHVIPLIPSPQLIQELEQRLLVVFTGQVRLAHQVLQKVVSRYLRRDGLLISSIKRLADLAKVGRQALMYNDLDELGRIMSEAWRIHQELDPFCSNKLVDELFAFSDRYCCGYKLVGAGGGGFALLLANDVESASTLKRELETSSKFDVAVYAWSIFTP